MCGCGVACGQLLVNLARAAPKMCRQSEEFMKTAIRAAVGLMLDQGDDDFEELRLSPAFASVHGSELPRRDRDEPFPARVLDDLARTLHRVASSVQTLSHGGAFIGFFFYWC